MLTFKNSQKDISAQQFYESIEDKESYYWQTSGKYTYGVLLRHEQNKKINTDMSELIERAKKLKFHGDESSLNKLLNSVDFVTAEQLKMVIDGVKK